MKIITAKDVSNIGFGTLFASALKCLEKDLHRWQKFRKSARHAIYHPHGVFELMPCADDTHYTYKYVNAHPANPEVGKLSVVAFGMLADIETGYPQLACDMTILTAFRTAAMSAVAAKHLAKKDSKVLGLIGTGAQSEFQVYAIRHLFPIKTIRYYDRDKKAMEKFARNLVGTGVELIACKNGDEVVHGVDILTTCICEKKKVKLFDYASVKDNDHLYINAMGGDCPGKTELDVNVLKNSRIVVEFYEQTKHEGEIQNLKGKVKCDEIWEIVQGKKKGRTKKDRIIVFDSVGFAVADFSVMRMLHEYGVGTEVNLIPELENPKDLFSLFGGRNQTSSEAVFSQSRMMNV